MCQVKPFGSSRVIVVWSCWKTETFAFTKIIFINHRNVLLLCFFWQKINIQIAQVVLIFQNFWSFRSIRNIQIATDYSVFDRFCFLCVVCLFWWLYGFLWWVFAIEKLEYSRYNTKINLNLFDTILIVVVYFLILTDLTKVLLSFVWLKFSSFGLSYDGWRKDGRA